MSNQNVLVNNNDKKAKRQTNVYLYLKDVRK